MTKEETKMMKNAIDAAILQKTKDEILSELSYLVNTVESRCESETADQICIKIADIIEDVSQLITDIEFNLALEEVEQMMDDTLEGNNR